MAASIEVKWQTILILVAAVFVFLLSLLILSPETKSLAELKQGPDRCLTCHEQVQDMSASHPVQTFGCAACHLGNPLAETKDDAHAGMVRNPSDLFWAEKTCGKADCHPDLTYNVKNSIMATNAGLVAATLFQWEERSVLNDSLIHIHQNLPDTSLASSHVRKLCAGCHLNKKEHDFPGEIGRRGGGCNDCHLVRGVQKGEHPRLTVEMEISVCEKCHNRSNRTALNYQGKFESEGYGTPFTQGGFSPDTLSGGRFYYHIPGDVHFEAGMVCIDCHTAEEVMGDGRKHAHLEDQVQVRCEDCHRAKLSKPDSANLVWKVIQVNRFLSLPQDSLLARSSGGGFLANVRRQKGRWLLIGKTDGRVREIKQINNTAACALNGHERLSCQACHAAYTPQCYGCHDVYDPNQKQMDKITYRETEGKWQEFRSYLRFEKPALGVDQFGRIIPMAPGCQVYLTVLDKKGEVERQNFWPTMAGFDPHATRKQTASCTECHSDPKRMGLGEGVLQLVNGRLEFAPTYDSGSAGLGMFALEQMVDTDGRPLQKMSRSGERPFNRQEIKRIFRVSYCLVCHEKYDDPIYEDYALSLKRFSNRKAKNCSGR